MHLDTFIDELERRCGREYRVRWSPRTRSFHVEQKVARTLDYPGNDDKAQRLRDGVRLVLDLGHPTEPCPRCERPVEAATFERAEVECPSCRALGWTVWVTTGYFPLVDKTLASLERWHPRLGEEPRAEMDAQNAALARSHTRHRDNVAESLALEHYSKIVGIPSVGYTKAGTPHSYGSYGL